MPQFFVPSSAVSGNRCRIDGEDFHHLARVHRVKTGDEIRCFTDNNRCFTAKVTKIGPSSVEAELLEYLETGKGPSLTLWAALLKGKNFDFVIQKGTELGLKEIVPVITERTVPVIKKDRAPLERWRRIAHEAAKQSMGPGVPRVREPVDLRLSVPSPPGLKIIAHTEAEETLKGAVSGTEARGGCHLLIGPEGGFSPGEVAAAETAGWKPARFGFTSLRAETAAIVIASLMLYELEG